MISVIVPVYNVEAYLSRCIDSILTQSYRDFELLLVDDGSTDGTADICDEYEKQDVRVHTFHKQNGGVSDARNFGLDNAKGEFLCFVDADDYVGQDYLRILLEMMQDNKADISIISKNEVFSADVGFVESEDQRFLLQGEELFCEIIKGGKFTWASWGKLYRKRVFDKIRFKQNMVYDDFYTMPYLLEQCGCCAYSTAKQYYYFQRESSLTHSISESQVYMWQECMDKLICFTKESYPGCYQFVQRLLVISIFWIVIDRLLYSVDYIRLAGKIRRKYRIHFSKAFQLPGLTKKERCKAFLFLISIRIYRFVRLIWIKGNKQTQRRILLQKPE